MRGVQVSELELGTDGGITVKSLATVYEDGEVVGASYLASSLRKSVEARGPLALESVVRLYNNGYYGASWLDKGKTYIREHSEAPPGTQVETGPRGGLYYETEPHKGKERVASSQEIHHLIDVFKKTAVGQIGATTETAEDQCGTVTRAFGLWLQRLGIQTDVVYVEGYARSLKRAASGWQSAAKHKDDFPHFLNRASGIWVDWSAKQFDARMPWPWVTDYRGLDDYWDTIKILNKKGKEVVFGPELIQKAIGKSLLQLWATASNRHDWRVFVASRARLDSNINKGRVYLKEGQEAPVGMAVEEGPRGGRYYYTAAGRGRPVGKAPKDWRPTVGERVRLRMPGNRFNGRLARVTSIEKDERSGKWTGYINGIGWWGGAYITWDSAVPAPYTAKEKKEMTARDILVAEFGKTRVEQRPIHDSKTGLDYDTFNTEAGPLLLIKSEPGKDKPWVVNKDSAVSLGAFMGALMEMPTEALQSMKDEVAIIIFSPVSNPADRKTSQMIGAKFTSAASMDAGMRTMYIWPASKESDATKLAKTLIHETGHAIDRTRSDLGAQYLTGVRKFWADLQENEGIQIPASIPEQEAIEAERGVPPDPNKWHDDWGRWMNVALGQSDPDAMHYWPSIMVEEPWRKLSLAAKKLIEQNVQNALPVSNYASRNDKEYYAEAYTQYQLGTLSANHIMSDHFKNLERVREWLKD